MATMIMTVMMVMICGRKPEQRWRVEMLKRNAGGVHTGNTVNTSPEQPGKGSCFCYGAILRSGGFQKEEEMLPHPFQFPVYRGQLHTCN